MLPADYNFLRVKHHGVIDMHSFLKMRRQSLTVVMRSHYIQLLCRQNVNCDLLDWQEEEYSIATKWRFSAVLKLPWRPLLAAKCEVIMFLLVVS